MKRDTVSCVKGVLFLTLIWAFGSCTEADVTPGGELVCGDGVLSAGEACDGDAGASDCSAYDPTKQWKEGGKPVCKSDCSGLEIGTCEEVVVLCPNGKLDEGEVCDGDAGASDCSAYDPTKQWKEGGKPVCKSDCSGLEIGTCEVYGSERVVFMNWNVLFEYDNHNGEDLSLSASVDDRATKLTEILGKYPEKPDFMSIVEVSPVWHSSVNTEKLRSLGYEWAINEKSSDGGREPLSDVIYQASKYDLLETGFVNLLKTDGSPVNLDKNIALYAVLENKTSHVQYAVFSTHWDPNNVWADADNNGSVVNVVGWVTSHESNRIRGAKQSAELIASVREKYPNAHVVYGGDFNTIDLDILFSLDDSLKSVLSTVLSFYVGIELSLNDLPSLIASINSILSQSEKKTFALLPDDFVGAHAQFGQESGLTDARGYAKAHQIHSDSTRLCNINDVENTCLDETDYWTTSDPGIPAAIAELGVAIVIDYAFFSAETMRLLSYSVMTDGDSYGNTRADYVYVSDHFPVKTVYEVQY